jgi:hypothetical protein
MRQLELEGLVLRRCGFGTQRKTENNAERNDERGTTARLDEACLIHDFLPVSHFQPIIASAPAP